MQIITAVGSKLYAKICKLYAKYANKRFDSASQAVNYRTCDTPRDVYLYAAKSPNFRINLATDKYTSHLVKCKTFDTMTFNPSCTQHVEA